MGIKLSKKLNKSLLDRIFYPQKYIFSLTSNELLGAIVRGEIDTVELAKKTLENRGYDEKGNWVGFKK